MGQDKEKSKDIEKVAPHVGYAGFDQGFWDNIQIAFREIVGAGAHEFKFSFWKEKDSAKIQQLCSQIIQAAPKILYIDMSSNVEAYLFLAKTLKRQNSIESMMIIGILPAFSTRTALERCMLNGPDEAFVKGPDFHSMVYGACCFIYGEEFKPLDKVTIKIKQDSAYREFVRINYIAESTIRFETNSSLNPGDKVFIECNLDPKIAPALNIKVTEKDQKEIFYDYPSAFNGVIDWEDAQFAEKLYLNSEFHKEAQKGFPPKGKPTDEEITLRNGQIGALGERIQKTQMAFKKWMKQEGHSYNDVKRVRVLSIDRLGTVFSQVDRLFHEYPFSLRWQSILKQPKDLIGQVRPQIITYLLEPKAPSVEVEEVVPPNERKDGQEKKKKVIPGPPRNDIETLIDLIKTAKSIGNYQPFFILFQTTKKELKEIQNKVQYNFILSHEGVFSLQTVLSLSAILDKKIKDHEMAAFEKLLATENEKRTAKFQEQGGVMFTPAKLADVMPLKKFFKKNGPDSWGYISGKLEIKSLSEIDILFKTAQKFPLGSVIQVLYPAVFYITITNPQKSQAGEVQTQGLQRGIIHGLEEGEKEKLSKYINMIYLKYFADKEGA